MALTFADTHNMITYLTKSDASEGFNQITDFLNASLIKYALTVNPNIYVSCIKQFWSFVSVKKVNDVVLLQALIDRKKVIITEDTVQKALRLDDAESIDCLPNEEIFTELARIGTTWNEFSSSMASAVICLSTGKGFSGVETHLFEGMLVQQQAAVDVDDVVADSVPTDDVPAADAKPTPPSPPATTTPPPPQELPSISQVMPTPPLLPIAQQSSLHNNNNLYNLLQFPWIFLTVWEIIAKINVDEDVIMEEVDAEEDAKVVEKNANVQGRLKECQAKVYHIDLKHADKILSMQDDVEEPGELQEVIEVVTTAKLMTKVVTVATTTITVAAPITPATITAAPTTARRRKGVVIRDLEENATPSTIVHTEPKYKDKVKGILVEEPKPLKKQAQIKQDEAYARELEAEINRNINWDDVIKQVKEKGKQDNVVLRYQALKRKPQTEAHARKNMMVYLKNMAEFKMDYFKGMSYDDIRPIFEKYFNSNVAFLEKSKEQLEEEESKALKRQSESLEEKASKKQKLDEEVEELKKHLQIVLNDDDDVYTEDTPLALKDPIGRLEMLWQIVQERFASSKPKNFSDDFLLSTLTYIFKKHDVEAQVWKNQRGVHGLAKVKSWRLLESCEMHIITFTTTHMILLVERRYPLTRFTLEQMLNNVRLEVKEESEVSLELLRFVRQQHQEGYRT
nr:hypothetical protein [Tanacetum cinerariifolium]